MTVDTRTLRVVALDPADEAAVAASYEVGCAVRTHDLPDLPVSSRHRHDTRFRVPWPGQLARHWLAYDGDRAAGRLDVSLPQRDNLTNAWIELEVHPAHRRRGIGRALYAQATEFARQAGRSRLMGVVNEPLDGGASPGGAFVDALGLRRALREVRRKLHLHQVDDAALDRLLAAAWTRAAGYTLLTWRDRCPEDCVADIAYLDGRLSQDAPMEDLAWEPDNIDAAHVREMERARAACGSRSFHTAARHDACGRVVAWTALAFEHGVAEHAWQGITIVDPQHRGHRLGTIVKIENLRYARAGEPALTSIDTWNAGVNDHMIAINDAMGFRPVDLAVDWQVDM